MKALHRVHDSIIEEMKNRFSILVDNEDFEFKKTKESWSKKELVGHLIDSALNNHRRFILAPDQQDLIFDGYEQDKWVFRNKYQDYAMENLSDLLIQLNKLFCHLVKGMDFDFLVRKTKAHNFDKIGMNSIKEGEESSLSFFYWDYLFHLEHHLAQLFPDYTRKLKSQSDYKCI